MCSGFLKKTSGQIVPVTVAQCDTNMPCVWNIKYSPLDQGLSHMVMKSTTGCSISRTVVDLPWSTVIHGDFPSRSTDKPPENIVNVSLLLYVHRYYPMVVPNRIIAMVTERRQATGKQIQKRERKSQRRQWNGRMKSNKCEMKVGERWANELDFEQEQKKRSWIKWDDDWIRQDTENINHFRSKVEPHIHTHKPMVSVLVGLCVCARALTNSFSVPSFIHSVTNEFHSRNPTYPIFVVLRSTLWIGLHVSNFPSLFVLAVMEIQKQKRKMKKTHTKISTYSPTCVLLKPIVLTSNEWRKWLLFKHRLTQQFICTHQVYISSPRQWSKNGAEDDVRIEIILRIWRLLSWFRHSNKSENAMDFLIKHICRGDENGGGVGGDEYSEDFR